MFATSSFADGSALNLNEARRLLNEGKADQSAALLQKDVQTFAGNADYDYLLGLALYKSGQTGEAMFAFERVLMSNPGNVDVRLKAARISLDRGDAANARELLLPLAEQPLDEGQRQEAKNIYSAISTTLGGGSLSMYGYLLSGIGFNDNVTGGPNQSSLIIPALNPTNPPPSPPPQPTQLGSSSRAQDTVGMIEAGLSLQQAVGEDTWLTGAGNIRQSYNSTRADVGYGYSNLNLGILIRNGHEFFGAAALGQVYQVANVTYRNSFGPRLNWTHAFDNNVSLTSYLQQLTFAYPSNSIDNTLRSIAGLTLESTVGDAGTMQYGIYGGREVAQDQSKPHFSFHLWGASLGCNFAFNKELLFSAAASYEARTHDSKDMLYLVTRKDALLTAGTSLDYKLSDSWHLIPTYTYSEITSNTELYAFNQNIFMLQLKWDFDNAKN
jgi:hypothetical protein